MSRSHIISLCLIGTGAIAWAFVGRPLINNSDLKLPLNPLGINGSPYGEVLAMAMQGPVGEYADVGISGAQHSHAAGEECTEDHDHAAHDHVAHDTDHEGHSHEEGETCDEHDEAPVKVAQTSPGLGRRFGNLLTALGKLPEVRTNPYAAGEGLKTYLRRKAEDKLRFAYQLDPSHYGNYVVLHFFLTEPAVGTGRQLTSESVKLANDTIAYCMKRDDDPRPALTAAAAATNILQLMFIDQHEGKGTYSSVQMRECLTLADTCMRRYFAISAEWEKTGNWELLSPQRILECQERVQFLTKMRESCQQTIVRIEGENPMQAENSPIPETLEKSSQTDSHDS